MEHISHVQNILFISSECPFHTRGCGNNISSIHHYSIFLTTKVNMLTKSENFKKSKNNKKICNHMPSQLISFYLLISLEGMSTLIRSQGHQIEPFFLFCFRSRFRSCLLIVFVKPSPPFFSTLLVFVRD